VFNVGVVYTSPSELLFFHLITDLSSAVAVNVILSPLHNSILPVLLVMVNVGCLVTAIVCFTVLFLHPLLSIPLTAISTFSVIFCIVTLLFSSSLYRMDAPFDGVMVQL